jgi:predicted transcriptional regulator
MTQTRSRIRDCVYRNPGIHFSAVQRKLDIATGQAQYHLRKLCRSEGLEKEGVCGRTHYYPPTFSDWERGAVALLRRETSREIVLFLLDKEPIPPAQIADRLGLARSTVEWHLSRLVEYDMAKKRRPTDGTDEVVVTLTHDAALYRLLREIEPHMLDRVVDRFSRLTDDLLEG